MAVATSALPSCVAAAREAACEAAFDICCNEVARFGVAEVLAAAATAMVAATAASTGLRFVLGLSPGLSMVPGGINTASEAFPFKGATHKTRNDSLRCLRGNDARSPGHLFCKSSTKRAAPAP